MIIGFTYRFSNRNNQRSWTESWYTEAENGTGTAVIEADLRAIARSRARALVSVNQIVDTTWWNVLTPKIRTIIGLNIPGTLPFGTQDVAPVAVLLQLSSGLGKRQYEQRGISDADMVEGFWSPNPLNVPGYNAWGNRIKDEPLMMRASVFGPSLNIDTIVDGLITFTAAPVGGIARGTPMSVRTHITGGGPRVATRVVARADSVGPIVQVDWTRGTCEGGDVRKLDYAYSNFTTFALRTAGRTRKTGGPFGRFRGKR